MKSPVEVIDEGEFSACEVELKVTGDKSQVFKCEESLRLLPGRRLTCLAHSDNKKYVVKIFPKIRRSRDEFDREVAGYELLHNASITVPGRIYYGPASPDVNIIVYSYIHRSRSLEQVFSDRKKAKSSGNIMQSFIDSVIRLHRDGLIHEDPHLGNFLLKSEELYVLDAGAVRQTANESLLEDNFALFVAQFPVSWHVEESWLDAYVDMFHKSDADEARVRLHKKIKSRQDWRENHVLNKAYRQCTAFSISSTLNGKTVVNRDYEEYEFDRLFLSPEEIFDTEEVEMLKEGNSSTVGLVNIKGKDFVIKRYNMKNIAHRVKRIVRESRASRSWRNSHRLMLRGFLTARPVAMHECMRGKMKGVSFFVMESLPGISSVHFFRNKSVSEKGKKVVAKGMLSLISELHKENLCHGDLKSTNFIIVDDQPYLIDLDAMKLLTRKRSIMKCQAGDVKRFKENWDNDPKTEKLFSLLYEEYGFSHV